MTERAILPNDPEPQTPKDQPQIDQATNNIVYFERSRDYEIISPADLPPMNSRFPIQESRNQPPAPNRRRKKDTIQNRITKSFNNSGREVPDGTINSMLRSLFEGQRKK